MIIDEQIIQDCIDGKRSAQEKLYRKFSSPMYGICLRYAASPDDAEDILQEGFIKVFNNIANFRREGSFEGWVKRIIINTALNHYHQTKKLNEQRDFDEINEINIIEADETVEVPYTESEMMEAIQALPAGYKMVFNLYVFEEFKHHEIAEQLNISVNTSKSQLSKARVYLQKSLAKKKPKRINDL